MEDSLVATTAVDSVSAPAATCPWSAPRAFDVELFGSIADAAAEQWDRVVGGRGLFLQRRYLRAIEASNNVGVQSRTAVFRDAGRPVGVAVFQIVDFTGPPIAPLLATRGSFLSFVARRLRLIREPLALEVIVCGSAFLTGEHGFAFLPGTDSERAVHSLLGAVKAIATEFDADETYTGVLFKDFCLDKESIGSQLVNHAYSEVETEPTMILDLDPQWQSFADYLASLSSKYRVKAKRAYIKSQDLVMRELTVADVHRHHQRMAGLLEAVRNRAEYRLGRLDIEAFAELRKQLDDEFLLRGYFLGDEMVGFASGFVIDQTLEAHFVGIDYTRNRAHAIYERMLYDYLQTALQRGVTRVNYGRTAAEIKSTLGAVPVATRCYFKHKHRALNRFLPAVSRRIRASVFAQRKPFKKSRDARNEAAAPA